MTHPLVRWDRLRKLLHESAALYRKLFVHLSRRIVPDVLLTIKMWQSTSRGAFPFSVVYLQKKLVSGSGSILQIDLGLWRICSRGSLHDLYRSWLESVGELFASCSIVRSKWCGKLMRSSLIRANSPVHLISTFIRQYGRHIIKDTGQTYKCNQAHTHTGRSTL